MNHSKQIVRSSAKIFSSQILVNLFSVGFTIFLAHTLSKIDFATFAVFSILAELIRITVNLGLETSCTQRVPELIARAENDKASAMMKTALLSRTILSAFFALLIFSFSTTVSQIFLKTGDYDYIIRIMCLGILFSSLNDSLGQLAQVIQQFGKISIINVIVSISSRSLSIALYFLLGLKGYIIGFTWTPIVSIILYLLLLRRWLFVKSGFYPWLELVKYSLPFYGMVFMRFSLMQFDDTIIGVLLEPASLATYFVAKRFYQYIFMLTDVVDAPVKVKISELKKEGLNRISMIFTKASRYYCFIYIPLCLGVAAASYPLLHLYGGHKYTEGTFILILLSLGMLMYSLRSVYGINVFNLGKPKEIFKLEGIGGLANIVFAAILIYSLETIGLALTKLLSFTVVLFYARFLLKKIIAVQFDKGALKDSLVASLAMAAVIAVLQLIYYTLVIIPLYILAGMITFMLIFSRRLDRKDIELVENFLPGRFRGLVKIFYWFGAERLEEQASAEG